MQRARLVKKRKSEYRVFVKGPSVWGNEKTYFDARFDTKEEAKKFIEDSKGKGDFFRMYKREFDFMRHEWTSNPVIIEEVYG